MRRWLIVLLALVVVPEAQATAPKQYRIELALFQGDPHGSREKGTVKSLGEPQLVTLAGRPAEYSTGGELLNRGELVTYGRSVRCVVEPAGRKLKVRVTLEHKKVLRSREGRAEFQTHRATYQVSVYRGETIKVRFAREYQPQTWVEIRVTEANP